MHIDFAPPSNGTYNNTGSSQPLANYLEHEDLKRMEKGIYAEGFFNLTDDNIYKSKVIKDIDSNIGQLLKTDAKFYAIHVSPSKKELQAMGNTEQEQAKAMKHYIREVFIPKYAKNFNKGLSASDIKFYGKIHFDRSRSNNELNMHCHLIVSRKDQTNKKKLSPVTNHKNTKNGIIKGGFDRVNLFQQVEEGFDRLFSYNRQQTESFNYHNMMKNSSISEQLTLQEQNIQSSERKNKINQDCNLSVIFENKEINSQAFKSDSKIKEKNDDHISTHQSHIHENNLSSKSFIPLTSSGIDFSRNPTLLEEQTLNPKKKKKKGRKL